MKGRYKYETDKQQQQKNIYRYITYRAYYSCSDSINTKHGGKIHADSTECDSKKADT